MANITECVICGTKLDGSSMMNLFTGEPTGACNEDCQEILDNS